MTTLKEKMALDLDRLFDTGEHAATVTITPKGGSAKNVAAIINELEPTIQGQHVYINRRLYIRADNDTTGFLALGVGAAVSIEGRLGTVVYAEKSSEGLQWQLDCQMGIQL